MRLHLVSCGGHNVDLLASSSWALQQPANYRTAHTASQVIAAFAAAQLLGQRAVPGLLQAVNANMLLIFLVANVLTGLINMGIDTLGISDWAARGMVACYMLCLCVVADAAYRTTE